MEEEVTPQDRIANALARLATIAEKWFDKAYAPRRNPLDVRDAHITTLPTAEESLRQEQGQTGEATTEEWIGTREQRLLDDSAEKSPTIKARGQKKRRAAKAESKPE